MVNGLTSRLVAAEQVDAKIVEVALFFQRELERARAPGAAGAAAAAAETARPAMTVLLLSADNAQVRCHVFGTNLVIAVAVLYDASGEDT